MIQTTASHPDDRKPCRILCALTLCAAAFAPAAALAQQPQWIQPTPEELSMTSFPGYPGVAAVVLNRELITKDDLHSEQHYNRIKILSDDGKKYADVELPFVNTTDDFKYGAMQSNQEDIQGRTIHPDGTIVPFTGKPYLKTIEKTKGVRVLAKVFTLPDVTVGSIIEYRYSTRIDDFHYAPPDWIIQGDLYVKSAHYMWYPTSHDNIVDEKEQLITSISWFPILPKGVEITHHEVPGMGYGGLPQYDYEVSIKDVPPIVDEEFMPPLRNYSYRVYWSYVAERNGAEFWKNHGKEWSKRVNSFSNPNSDLKSATQQIVASANTQDQKLRLIYAAVQKIENTDYTREHEDREDKAEGGKVNNVADVYKHERGNSTQLTELFIGMARAAGMEADAMLVPDRSREAFLSQWLNMNQFDDLIAVVTVDGKEQFFDPGERYCPYGQLAWQHQYVTGLRQKGNETTFGDVSGGSYKDNETYRVANLTMDTNGNITGRIDMTYFGATALRWRHAALRGDDESLKHELRTNIEEIIPHSLEVKEVTVTNVPDYEQPLKVSYNVEGTLGTWTGKRLVLPADIFLVNHKATFPHEKREVAVDFNYPSGSSDALRINFPASFSIEAAPSAASYNLNKFAAYKMTIDSAATNFTTKREYAFNNIYILPADYPQLRTFYSQFETNDQQSVVLKSTAAPTTTASATPGPSE